MSKMQRSFTGDFEILASIGRFVAESVKEASLSESDVYALQLAVDEAATNIIEYAYRDEGQGRIDLTVEPAAHKVVITLHDTGQPFDPNDVAAYVSDVPIEEMQERGAGLHLIHAIMDEVDFKFDKRKGNTLQMVKVIA
jgi:serine/threonine-protein kinase RsbW